MKFTEPVPFATTVPVNPVGAVLGVTTEPFVSPPNSVASACNCARGTRQLGRGVVYPHQGPVRPMVRGLFPKVEQQSVLADGFLTQFVSAGGDIPFRAFRDRRTMNRFVFGLANE